VRLERNSVEAGIRNKFEERLEQKNRDDRRASEETSEDLRRKVKKAEEQLDDARLSSVEVLTRKCMSSQP